MDIRELRIGNHVLYKGEQVEICGTVDFKKFDPAVALYTNEGIRLNVRVGQLSPIPLTEELLKELGFEEEKPQGEGWDYGIEKVFLKEFGSPVEEDYFISMAQYEGGLYQLQVLGTIAYVRELHELQGYIYLTCKKELF